jgi:hypothetical protein
MNTSECFSATTVVPRDGTIASQVTTSDSVHEEKGASIATSESCLSQVDAPYLFEVPSSVKSSGISLFSCL